MKTLVKALKRMKRVKYYQEGRKSKETHDTKQVSCKSLLIKPQVKPPADVLSDSQVASFNSPRLIVAGKRKKPFTRCV